LTDRSLSVPMDAVCCIEWRYAVIVHEQSGILAATSQRNAHPY
jgi:hypothetical protein